MTQLTNALESFKNSIGGGQYPPDGTNAADLQQFCTQAWPRVYWVTGGSAAGNYNVNPPKVPYPTVTPDTALCFWLGGAQDADGHFIGFSANPTNPFDAGQSRIPVAFAFPHDATLVVSATGAAGYSSGLTNSTTGSQTNYNLYYYYPPNGKAASSNQPYVYYKAVAVQSGQPQYSVTPIQPGKSANPSGNFTLPYRDSTSNMSPQSFVNSQNYQLLCPGIDGKYGNYSTTGGTNSCPLYPSGANYDPNAGVDDMANFTKGPTVGSDTQ